MVIKKSNNRSQCRVCGIELTSENAYGRKDTTNRLHSYCRKHYLQIQKDRALRVKTAPYLYTLDRGPSNKPFKIYFNTLEEKHSYIRDRYIQDSCEYTVSCVSGCDIRECGCSPSFGDPDVCDECGGDLYYDERSLLICELCGLEADVTPFYRESPLPLRKGRHAWTGDLADSLCQDAFYSRAYRKG